MAEPRNKQELIELEYCFDKYFSKNFVPILDKEYKELKDKQAEEYRRKLDSRPVAPGMSGMMNASMAAQEVRMTGVWNTKSTDYLLEQCNEKFFSDKNAQEDINQMTVAWRAAIVSEIGVDKYKELSEGLPTGDLASFYVANRFQTLMMEELARKEMPKSSLEYIMRKGFQESLPGLIVGIGMKSSENDERVKKLSERYYNPSASEKGAAFGLSFVMDAATTGGYGSVGKAAAWLGADAALHGAVSMLPEDQTVDQIFSATVWGDKDAIDKMRNASKALDPKKSADIKLFNTMLNNQLYQPSVSNDEIKALYVKLRHAIPQERGGAALAKGLEAGLKKVGLSVSGSSSVPNWMTAKEEKELYHSAFYYSAVAMDMAVNGVKEIILDGKNYTADQVAQKSYDYARSFALKQEETLVEKENLEMGYSPDAGNDDTVSKAQSPQDVNVAGLSGDISTHYVLERQFGFSQNPGQTQYSAAQVSQGQGLQQGQQLQYQQLQYQQQQQDMSVSGWGGLVDQLGLNGFSNVGKNLGYMLAMLPDMLIGMFTGKTRNLRFEDNLFPIGAILLGMFVKNPILKLLLIGLGGANLLNKASKEVMDTRRAQNPQAVIYRKYDDQLLDSRIKNPVMKGNTLIATFDGVPVINTISKEAVDAYYKGDLPLNVLSNAVLRKYDEQQQAVIQNYDREVAMNVAAERSRGLK